MTTPTKPTPVGFAPKHTTGKYLMNMAVDDIEGGVDLADGWEYAPVYAAPPALPDQSLLLDMASMLSSFVEDDVKLTRKEARKMLNRIRATRIEK